MKTILGLALVGASIVAGMLWFVRDDPVLSAEELRSHGLVVMPTAHRISGLQLQDHHGGKFTEANLLGRWTFAYFGYTSCPDICPVNMAVLAQLQRTLEAGDKPSLLSQFQAMLVSVDPERDPPDVLAQYLGSFSQALVGVTGPASEILKFARQVNVGFGKTPVPNSEIVYLMDHSSYLIVIDPSGAFYGVIKPPFDSNKLLHTYRSIAAAEHNP